MNWDRIEGEWKQLAGKAQQAWCHLTGDDFGVIAGRRAELAGKLQSRYGISRHLASSGVGGRHARLVDRWFDRSTSSRS